MLTISLNKPKNMKQRKMLHNRNCILTIDTRIALIPWLILIFFADADRKVWLFVEKYGRDRVAYDCGNLHDKECGNLIEQKTN